MPFTRIPPEQRFWPKVEKTPTCWLWKGTKRGGYGLFKEDPTRSHVSAHRFAWTMVNGPIPSGLAICHTCDVRACVNPAHMFLGTALDNNRDRKAKGRNADTRGESNPSAKLTWPQVRAIRADRRIQAEIAADYGISQGTVSAILLNQLWIEPDDSTIEVKGQVS